MNSILEVNNLDVSLKTLEGEVKAIRNISFKLNKGEILAIVGESGCGKTVLCRSIMRILPKIASINNGEILLHHKDLLKLPEKSMQLVRGREIAMVLQDPMTALNPTISIGKQIMEVIRIHEKCSKKEAKKRAIDLMELVGIDNASIRFNQYPHHFSGGMRQRIVIAIALACSPSILIADEPTTALDVTTQSKIIELLKNIQKKLELSIIFISHDLGVVASIADKIAVMYGGKIVEMGTDEDIFYNAQHPYTWGLLNSLPSIDGEIEYLNSIPGMPPNLINVPKGDLFAQRNEMALKIDYIEEPPMFKISETHSAATWLLHPDAPKINKDTITRGG